MCETVDCVSRWNVTAHRVLVLLFHEVLPQPRPDARTQRSEKSFTEITLFKMPVNVSAAAQTETAAGGRFKSVALGPRI